MQKTKQPTTLVSANEGYDGRELRCSALVLPRHTSVTRPTVVNTTPRPRLALTLIVKVGTTMTARHADLGITTSAAVTIACPVAVEGHKER